MEQRDMMRWRVGGWVPSNVNNHRRRGGGSGRSPGDFWRVDGEMMGNY